MFVDVDSPAKKIETTMTETITEQTSPQRGAQWLDEEVPGWADKIDLHDFDLGSASRCVCGYVFRDKAEEHALENQEDGYFDADPMTGYDWFTHTYNENSGYLGFTDDDDAYDTLENEWRGLIKERQLETA